jgi:hypothetical protein
MATITPRFIAQQIIRLAEVGDQSRDSELTEREVIELVINSATKLLKQEMYMLRQSPDGLKTIPAHLLHTFRKVPVKKLTVDGINFIELPGDYASLPMNEGVRRITPNTTNPYEKKAMIPVQHEELDVLGDIVGSMQNQWVFFVEGNKAYFYKKCGKTLCESGIEYLDVTLVSVGEIYEDEPLNAPPEIRLDIITNVLDILQVTYGISDVKDAINDNNAETA